MGEITFHQAIEEYKSIYLPARNLAERTREEYINDTEPVKSLDLAEIAVAIMRFLGSMFLMGLLLDPALIVVLEDGTWVEVMRWYE